MNVYGAKMHNCHLIKQATHDIFIFCGLLFVVKGINAATVFARILSFIEGFFFVLQDKDLILVPVCIEKLTQLPAHMSTVQMIRVVKDFNMEAEELARSVSEWMNLTANQRPAEYMIQVELKML